MAKISELETLPGSSIEPTVDLLVLADVSEGKTKKITPSQFRLGLQIDINSIANLKALSVSGLANGSQASVAGYYSPGDGGGGLFCWDGASSAADNGGTVIAPSVGTGRWLRIIDGPISVKWFGTRGLSAAEDTAAIRAAAAALLNNMTLVFPSGTYKVAVTEGTALVEFQNKTGITIRGANSVLLDSTIYSGGPANEFTPMFAFDNCKDIDISGVSYLGPIVIFATELGYKGGTFVYAKNGSENFTINAYIENCRYGVASGRYSDPTRGYNKGFLCDLRTKAVGYTIAHYLAENVRGSIMAEDTHRAAYLAGVVGVDLRVFFKNQYIADTQVLLTDAMTGVGFSRGCKDVDVVAVDMGSTVFSDPSWAVGISLSRVDPGTVYENIRMSFNVRGTNLIATKLGGFNLTSTGAAGYPFPWEPGILLRNIRISGIIDRSAQHVVSNGVGEIYVYTGETPHYATVDNITFDHVIIKDSPDAPNPRHNYFVVPYLQCQATFRNCDFSTVLLNVESNPTSLITFIDCAIKCTHPNPGNTSRISLINTTVSDIAAQPLANTTLLNSPLAGAGAFMRSKQVDLVLSGATTDWVNAIPVGALVLGVSGRVTAAITGTTGYGVGVIGDFFRFVNTNALTIGSTFTPENAELSEEFTRSYPGGPTTIRVAAKTDTFTGGKLRLVLFYIVVTPPGS